MYDESTVHLHVNNQSGSVEHYYHFLLGFLFPLALRVEMLERDQSINNVLTRSCGPMDKIIRELNYQKLRILPRGTRICSDHNDPNSFHLSKRETLSGMDFKHGNYPQKQIRKAAFLVRSRLSTTTEQYRRRDLQHIHNSNKTVLLINRSTDPYFDSSLAEIKWSGLQRRSIRNFMMVRSAIEAESDIVVTVTLEHMPLATQIALFSHFGIVVAQHGAALANVVWCNPGTRVVEIAPRGFRSDCFPPLSDLVGAKHILVNQEGVHGDCDIEELRFHLR
jgi:Glycosyltransferase 61